jgi:hypothetical protein
MSTVLFAIPFLTALFAAGYFVITYPMVLTITIPRRSVEPYVIIRRLGEPDYSGRAGELLDHAIARYTLVTSAT